MSQANILPHSLETTVQTTQVCFCGQVIIRYDFTGFKKKKSSPPSGVKLDIFARGGTKKKPLVFHFASYKGSGTSTIEKLFLAGGLALLKFNMIRSDFNQSLMFGHDVSGVPARPCRKLN